MNFPSLFNLERKTVIEKVSILQDVLYFVLLWVYYQFLDSKVIPKNMDNGRYQGPLLQARINFNPEWIYSHIQYNQ